MEVRLYFDKAEVAELTTLSEATIEEEVRQGRFPAPRMLEEKALWHVEDLLHWARTRPVVGTEERETELYRHFDAEGRLLYVGVSLSTTVRLMGHKERSEWANRIATITIERFPTRSAALQAERAAIKAEKPLHNIVHASKP